jgi:hypothetical protein
MEVQKFCVDCKWVEIKSHDRQRDYMRCGRRKDPTNGKGLNFCSAERRYSNDFWPWGEKYCGPEGKWWEPKETE